MCHSSVVRWVTFCLPWLPHYPLCGLLTVSRWFPHAQDRFWEHSPLANELGVGFHQVVRDVPARQVQQDVPCAPLHLVKTDICLMI